MSKPTLVLMERGRITASFGAGSVPFLEKQGWKRKSAMPRTPRVETKQDDADSDAEKADK